MTNFQTEIKNKLPSGFAYPLSASVLNQRLSEVPQKHLVKVSYLFYKPITVRRLQKAKFGLCERSTLGEKRLVVEAAYVRSAVENWTPNSWLEAGSRMNKYSSDKWSLKIYAVPTTGMEGIREQLDKYGFEQLAKWFLKTNEGAGSIGMHNIRVTFDGEALAYSEWDRI